MKECELAAPLATWLEARGFEIWAEVPSRRRIIDIIAWKPNIKKLLCIELKLGATKDLLYQCLYNRKLTAFCYGCVASNPRKVSVSRFKKWGIGLLCYNGTDIEVILKPCRALSSFHSTTVTKYRRKLLKRLETHPKGHEGGLALTKGDGPQIRCRKLIIAYRLNRPESSWKEIFRDVPNHYASYKSMRKSMTKFLKWEVKNFLANGYPDYGMICAKYGEGWESLLRLTLQKKILRCRR